MKVLGISGSPRKSETSGVNTLVKTVLENTGLEYELFSLHGKKLVRGCSACLGCVQDNVCKIQDDLTPLWDKMIEADAIVFGAPNYYSGMNVSSRAVMERCFQFRHQTGDKLWGKLAVAVGVGGTAGQAPADELEGLFLYNFIETVAKVSGQGAASCYSCGHGETCQVGIPAMTNEPGFKITEAMIPPVTKQPEVMEAAAQAGKLLGDRLRGGHDRGAVTQAMQERLMAQFGEAV